MLIWSPKKGNVAATTSIGLCKFCYIYWFDISHIFITLPVEYKPILNKEGHNQEKEGDCKYYANVQRYIAENYI